MSTAQPTRAATSDPTAWLTCLGLPLLAFLALPSPFNQAFANDPYLYTSLIHDYRAILERYGPTYYATRIAFIGPSAAFQSIFGPEIGYLALRVVVLAGLTTAVYAITRRFYGPAAALLAAALAAFNPWAVRSLAWDLYDGFTITYLLGAIAVLLAPRAPARGSGLLGGALLALSINSYPFMIVFAGPFLVAWIFFHRAEGKGLFVRAGFIAGGFFATYALLTLIMAVAFPAFGPFFEWSTIRAMLGLLGSANQQWFKPLSDLLHNGAFFLLLPFAVAVGLTTLIGRERLRPRTSPHAGDDFATAALLYLLGVCAVLLVFHYVLRAGTFASLWGVVLAFPATLLALVALLGRAFDGLALKDQWRLAWGFTAVVALTWLNARFLSAETMPAAWPVYLGLLLIAALGLGFSGILQRGAALLLMALAIQLPYGAREMPFAGPYPFLQMHSREQAALEHDVRKGAFFLLDTVARQAPLARGSIGFWYANDEGRVSSLQFVYLWGYSRVMPYGPDGTGGMPTLDAETRTNIARHHYLMVLSETEAKLDAGLTALATLPDRFTQLTRGRTDGKTWCYSYALVEREAPSGEDAAAPR